MRKTLTMMVMFLAGALSATIARAAEPVHYLEWDDKNSMFVDAVCTDYEVLKYGTPWLSSDTWYVVNSTVDLPYQLETYRNVKIILCDGAKLTVKGISIGSYETLTIYGQKEGTGILESTGEDGMAGIGGADSYLYINGGVIKAQGGSAPYPSSTPSKNGAGAGIGGYSGSGPRFVEINGGNVTAIGGDDRWTGSYPANGIGFGGFARYGNALTPGIFLINGGTVTAQGGTGNGRTPEAILMRNEQSDVLYGRSLYVGTDAASATVGTYYYAIDGMQYARFEPTLDPVDFLKWDSTSQKYIYARKQTYTVVTKDTTTFQKGGWYVVDDDVMCGSITVEGAAHLILKDGKTLTVYAASGKSGIYIGAGCSLTTYGQSANTGTLSVVGGFSAYGIEGAGQFVINGGKIVASGTGSIAIDTNCSISVDPYKNKAVRLNSLSESTVSMSEFLTNSFYRTTSYVMMPYEAYYVTYDGNGAVGMMPTSSFQPGELVSLYRASFDAIGYLFEGWTINGKDVVYADEATGKDFAKAGETLTLIAKWKPDPEGAKFSDAASLFSALRTAPYQGANLPATITFDSKVEVPFNWTIPTLPSTANVDVVYEDNGTKMWFENGVLYASPRNCQVSIHTLAIMVAVNDGKAPSAFKIREEVDGKTVENDVVFLYGDDKTFHNTIADALSADPRLWTVTLKDSPPYYVAYDGNGAVGAMSTSTFSPDELVSLSPVSFSAVGYLFEGWTINGKDVVYADEATGTNLVKGGETLRLIAKWKLDDKGVKISDFASLKKAFETAAQQSANFPIQIVFDSGVTIPAGETVTIPTGATKVDFVYEDNGTKMWLENGVLYATPFNSTVPTDAIVLIVASNGGNIPSAFKIRSKVEGKTVDSDVRVLVGSDGFSYDSLKDMMGASKRPATVTLRNALNIPEDYGLKEELTSQTTPGTVLKNNTIYTVKGHVLINAKANAGQSALKVPVGSAAILEIPAGCSLTVIGGDAEEQLGAGAGIEVPMGAKLIVCGEGKLTAIGGNAAPGERGHKGLAGEVTPLLDLNTFPFEELEKGDIGIGDAFGLMFGKGTLSKAIDSILLVGKGGTGGAGGYGGGGAAAGIGGKGGRGGNGGAETVGRRVVPGSQWGKHQEQYESWFETLGWEYPQTYGYATWNQHAGIRTVDGVTGSRGEQGGSGMASGEIIIAENVRVAAYPGEAATGGLSGRCGKSFSIYDLDHDNTQIMDFVVMGVQVAVDIAVTVMTGGGNKAAEGAHEAAKTEDEDDDDDDDDDEDDDTSQKLWFYGGGGGAGGAGGAAALQGIGPGGAGGGGGGAGGSGLFIIGSNLADEDNEDLGLEANGHGGLGGESYIPDGANAEEIRAKCFGQDANAINGGESAGQEPQKSTNPEAECFNLYTNAAAKAFWAQAGLPERKRLGCWTTNIENDGVVGGDLTADCFAYAGLPGLGGKAGGVKTDYTIYLANSAKVVAGLDESKKRDYPGKVFCKLTLVPGNGQPNTEDWYACGTAIAPCRIPSGSKVFAGYFTKPDGKGIEYFDKFGNPASFPFITGDMTLYAHWVDSDVDLGIRNCITHEGGSFTNACVTFQTGYVHYFTDDAEYGNSELSIPGARISGNAGETAIFYIPEGVEVEFTGGDGDGTEPGYPGIEVPAGLNLVITGGGTLVATGGSAGSPTEGGQGEAGYYKYSIDSVISGGGGAGGNGAGGAAPAIGGCGGKGGEGASGVPGDTVYCDGKRSCISGNNGPSGSSGEGGTSCGNVVIVGSLSVILEGGDGVEGALGGKTGGSGDDDGSKNAQNYTATGGGGGGGGGGSASALTIGGGIGGGGGGGSGGSGSTMNNDIEDAIRAGAGPGQGGFGGKTCEDAANGGNGEAPNVSTYTGEGNYSRSGYGGAAGAAGQAGSNGTYSRGLNLNVTAPESGDREKLGDTDYVFGHPTLQRTITFTFRGQKVGKILAMVGEALPSVIADQLEEVYGFEFAGAYLVNEKGEPVLDELGLEDWWYDEYGYGEKKYDVMGDVTLEVHFEPKWEKAADWPEMVDFVYDGNEHRVLETIDADAGFTVKGGTLSATDVGVYSVELQLKDGYEVWSDAETVEIDVATNAVRTWKWVIRPAEVDAKFDNQAYDWTNPTNAFVGVEGKIPAGMQTSYEIKNLYASGVYEVGATVSYPAGSTGNNYLPKVMNAVCTVPFAVNLKTVRPFGGRRAAFDFTLDEKSAESVLNSYSNLTVCAAIATNGSVDLSNTNAVHVLATVPVSETHLGYGTIVVDFGAAFPDYRGSVWTWFAIDGVPASAVNVVDVETAGAAEDALRLAPNVRYSVTEKGTNIVFTVMDTLAGKRYRIDYKAAKTDDWTEGEPVDGKNGVTEIAAPYQGETGFYRPREVKSEK